MLRSSIPNLLFRIFVVVLLAIFILLPLAQKFYLCFVSTLPHSDLPEGALGFLNYQKIFNSSVLMASISNSLIYVSLNVVLCLIVGLPAAYALSRYHFVGDRHILLVLLIFRITPPVT